jgi:hypothetical protein
MRKNSLFKWPVLAAGIVIVITACNNQKGGSSGEDATRTRDEKTLADPAKHPVPHMWVDYHISQQHEDNFRKLIGVVINSDETDSAYYTKGEFMGMLDHFSNDLPNIKYVEAFIADSPSGKLTILFSPIDSTDNLPKGYFALPQGVLTFSATSDLVPDNIAKIWKDNYAANQLKDLSMRVDPADGSNFPGGMVGAPNQRSNTLHIRYPLPDMSELQKEINYQSILGNDVSGFKMFFSAYPLRKGTLHDRVYVQYEFCKDDDAKNHNVFYIDTTTGFGQRPNLKISYNWEDKLKGVDNGQMCPPTCTP